MLRSVIGTAPARLIPANASQVLNILQYPSSLPEGRSSRQSRFMVSSPRCIYHIWFGLLATQAATLATQITMTYFGTFV